MLKLKENNSLIEIDVNNINDTSYYIKYAFLYKDVLFLIKRNLFHIVLDKGDKETYLYKYYKLLTKRRHKINIKLPYSITEIGLLLNAYSYVWNKKYNVKLLNTKLDENYFNAIDDIITKLGEKQFIFIDYLENYFLEYTKNRDDIFLYYDIHDKSDYLLLNGAVYEVEAK